jgi:hypothetical protein
MADELFVLPGIKNEAARIKISKYKNVSVEKSFS